MKQAEFKKCLQIHGFDPNPQYKTKNNVFGVTPQTKDSDFFNKTLINYVNNNGLLGGQIAYLEDNGIFFIFYKSHSFKKSVQGTYYLNYNDIKSYKYNSDKSSLICIFSYGSLFFTGLNKNFTNQFENNVPSSSESNKSFNEYSKYVVKLEDQVNKESSKSNF